MAQADAPLHYPWSANVIGLLNRQIHRGEARPILHMHGLVRGDLRSCGDSQRYWIGLRRDSLADHGRFRELCCFWPPSSRPCSQPFGFRCVDSQEPHAKPSAGVVADVDGVAVDDFKTVAVTATGSAAAVGDAIRTVTTIDALET